MTLLDAFAQLKSFRLKIMGTGPMDEELQKRIRELSLENVELLGFREGEAKWQVLRGARFGIIPSEWYENFPVVALELFATGKPIIASRIGGLPSIVPDGEAGLLFKACDPSDLAEKARFLIDYPEKAMAWGKSARKRAESLYNAEVCSQKLIDVFEAVLRRASELRPGLNNNREEAAQDCRNKGGTPEERVAEVISRRGV